MSPSLVSPTSGWMKRPSTISSAAFVRYSCARWMGLRVWKPTTVLHPRSAPGARRAAAGRPPPTASPRLPGSRRAARTRRLPGARSRLSDGARAEARSRGDLDVRPDIRENLGRGLLDRLVLGVDRHLGVDG